MALQVAEARCACCEVPLQQVKDELSYRCPSCSNCWKVADLPVREIRPIEWSFKDWLREEKSEDKA